MQILGRWSNGAGSVRSFPARPSALSDVRRFIRERAAETSFPAKDADDLVLAVSEAAANSTIHSGSEVIEVTWRPLERGAEVVIEDRGVFGKGGQGPPRGLGFGLRLIDALSDRVIIEPGTSGSPGTRVRVVKYRA